MAKVVDIFKNKKSKDTAGEVYNPSSTHEIKRLKDMMKELVEYCAGIADGHRGNLQAGDMIRKYGVQAVDSMEIKKVEGVIDN